MGDAPTGIAMLGGSFDPPHRTHRRMIEAAFRHLPIGRALVLPVGDHPQKEGLTGASDRLEMCRLAFADLPDTEVDDREVRRRGPSFTADTIDEIAREFPGRPLYWLIGSDNAPLLPTWKDYRRILSRCRVAILERLGHRLDERALQDSGLTTEERAHLLASRIPFEADGVSATDLRRALRAGRRDLRDLHPDVLAYIDRRGLYRS
ncbi:MAG: nicotinate (nicotinamide) nucleotide adenylyltransferase [Planctomycetota bacterium]